MTALALPLSDFEFLGRWVARRRELEASMISNKPRVLDADEDVP